MPHSAVGHLPVGKCPTRNLFPVPGWKSIGAMYVRSLSLRCAKRLIYHFSGRSISAGN